MILLPGAGEESMNWKSRQTQEPNYKKAKTQEDSCGAHKEDYITLVLIALLASVLITGLITPQLAWPPYFGLK